MNSIQPLPNPLLKSRGDQLLVRRPFIIPQNPIIITLSF